MRNFGPFLILFGVLVYCGPSLAAEVHLPQQTPDEIKAVCNKAGGRFSQDENGYDCGTDCQGKPGTDCVVHCAAGQKCVAQVIGARRPRDVLSALQAPARGH